MTGTRAASPILFLLLLPAGCFQPPIPRIEPPRARPALGWWEKEEGRGWRHVGEGEGVLLLPLRGKVRLDLEIRPGEECALAGILAGYKGPRDTQGILAFPGPPPGIGYFRWEGSKRIAPPTAVLPLDEGGWKKGFHLAVEIRRGAIRAFRGSSGPGLAWRPPVPLEGRIGLYAKGPALFLLGKSAPLEGEAPPPDPARIWSRFPPFRPGPCKKAAADLAARSLARLRKRKFPPPRLALPAWLWTGERIFRESLDAWASDPPLQEGGPRETAERVLDYLALHSCLPREEAESARARAQATALRLARSRSEDGLWKGASRDPYGAWILPGRALLEVLPLARGPQANILFQAWRTAMNRMVDAFLPGKDRKRPAVTWSTRDLLEAGLFLADSASRKAALSSSVAAVERILEENRLAVRRGQGLILLEKDGKEAPRLSLLWARLLSRLGGGGIRPGYKESSLRSAASWALHPGKEVPAFASLAALFLDVPRLAPRGALGILATQGQVVYAISWRDVHDAGAVFGTNKVSRDDAKAIFRIQWQVVEQALILCTEQVFALYGFDHGRGIFTKHLADQCLGQDKYLALVFNIGVVDLFAYRQ